MKKGFVIGLILVFSILVSCQNKKNKNDRQLLYWTSNNQDEIQFAEYIVKLWNRNNPEIPVRFQPVPEGRSSEEVILAAVVGQTTPDIYSNMWQGDVEYYARAGVLVSLDTINGFLTALSSRCNDDVIAEVTSTNGHIYQIPWKINPIMTIYNVHYMNQIGYENPPDTYSEFLDAGRKFQKDTDGDGYVDRWIGYCEVLVTWWQRFFDFYPVYLAASGGAKLIENDTVAFNNQYAVQTFEFFRELYKNNYFPKEMMSARQDVFLDEIIATRFTGPWEIAHAEKFKKEGFKYHFTHIPVPDDHEGPVYTYGDPKNIVIFNTCKYPENAWRFLNFMTSHENDLQLLKITSQLPRRKNLMSDSLFMNHINQNPKMIPFARQAEFVRGTDVSPVLKEVFDIISMEYEACVIYGVKSPQQAIEDAAKAASLLMQ